MKNVEPGLAMPARVLRPQLDAVEPVQPAALSGALIGAPTKRPATHNYGDGGECHDHDPPPKDAGVEPHDAPPLGQRITVGHSQCA